MGHKAFPYHIPANEMSHPRLSNMLMGRTKEKYRGWYRLGLVIETSARVKLLIYGMACNVYGGVGDLIGEEEFTNFTDEERKELDIYVMQAYTSAAELVLQDMDRQERKDKIVSIRKQMFGV